ncbi:MAG: DUF2878 domain-containing protein [Gammaproteobacteria bacterium]|nr:DUF2878 domain-containing protein [Gammaproteobacteria bacterium]
MKTLFINVIGFQVCWLGLVLSVPLAIPIALMYALWHLLKVASASERRLIALIVVAGTLLDSSLTAFGVFAFTPEPLLIPLWLCVLWLVFATTLKHSLRWLWTRQFWLLPLGGFGAAASYLAGERLGAVALPYSQVVTALILTGCWTLLWWGLWYGHRRYVAAQNTHAEAYGQNQDLGSSQ